MYDILHLWLKHIGVNFIHRLDFYFIIWQDNGGELCFDFNYHNYYFPHFILYFHELSHFSRFSPLAKESVLVTFFPWVSELKQSVLVLFLRLSFVLCMFWRSSALMLPSVTTTSAVTRGNLLLPSLSPCLELSVDADNQASLLPLHRPAYFPGLCALIISCAYISCWYELFTDT